jgi:hypothetical protein
MEEEPRYRAGIRCARGLQGSFNCVHGAGIGLNLSRAVVLLTFAQIPVGVFEAVNRVGMIPWLPVPVHWLLELPTIFLLGRLVQRKLALGIDAVIPLAAALPILIIYGELIGHPPLLVLLATSPLFAAYFLGVIPWTSKWLHVA